MRIRLCNVFLDCPALYDAPELYSVSPIRDGQLEWTPSLAIKFAFFGEAVLNTMSTLIPEGADILHCHDWHTGLLVRRLQETHVEPRPHTVLTIHNLAYQGWFPRADCPELALDGAEGIHFLAEGIRTADLVTTVSPRYAEEIQTPEFGCGLDETLGRLGVHGILNGIGSEWNPASDPLIPHPFAHPSEPGAYTVSARITAEAGWSESDDMFTLGIVARLDQQKGLDWVAEVIPSLARINTRLILSGTGSPELESNFGELGEQYPEHFKAWLDL